MTTTQIAAYCLGSMQTAWCRRLARYRVSKAMTFQPHVVPYQEAMFCKQHADIYAAHRNRILAEAREDAAAERNVRIRRPIETATNLEQRCDRISSGSGTV